MRCVTSMLLTSAACFSFLCFLLLLLPYIAPLSNFSTLPIFPSPSVFFVCLVFFFCFFRASPAACGRSQARGQIEATAAGLHHSDGNTRALTHWARPGIKPASSWFLVGFINHWAQRELLILHIFALLFPTISSRYFIPLKKKNTSSRLK